MLYKYYYNTYFIYIYTYIYITIPVLQFIGIRTGEREVREEGRSEVKRGGEGCNIHSSFFQFSFPSKGLELLSSV